MTSMENVNVRVVLTNNAQLTNETITRGKTKHPKDEVIVTLLSNGSVSFNYVKDKDGNRPFMVSLSNCDKISISKSRGNDALCIEIGCTVNHLIFSNRSLMENWYDTIVDLLNKLGYDFKMQQDPKNRYRRFASERLIRPRTSVRRKKAYSSPPNPDMYNGPYTRLVGQSIDEYTTPQQFEIDNVSRPTDENLKEYSYPYNDQNINYTNSTVKLPNDSDVQNRTYSNEHSLRRNSNVSERAQSYIYTKGGINYNTLPPLPDRPKEKHDHQVEPGDKNDDPVEPIASVDRETEPADSYIYTENGIINCNMLPTLPDRPEENDHQVEPDDRNDSPAEPIASVDRDEGQVEPVASVDRNEVYTEPITSGDIINYCAPSMSVGVDVTDGEVNCTEHIYDEYIEPCLHKNIPKQQNESKDNIFRPRSQDVMLTKPDIRPNKNRNQVVKRDDSRKHIMKHDLMREIKQPVIIKINKKELEGNIMLSMMKNCVFITGLKDSSLHRKLYEGDMITTINNQCIDSIEDAQNNIRKTATDKVELGIVRLPYCDLVVIKREENHSDIGFELDKRKVDRVDEDGLAASAGLRTTTTKATKFGRLTGTCVTAINGLPLSPHCTKEQTMELLSMHSDFVSLVVQPLDLIACLQQETYSPKTMDIYN